MGQEIETRVSILERQAADTQSILKELTGDVRKLVSVVTQQAEDRAALRRAFSQLTRLEENLTTLRGEIQAAKEEHLRKEAARATAELAQIKADRRKVYWTVLSYAIAGALGALFTHFGIPMVTK